MNAGMPSLQRAAPETIRFDSQVEFYKNSAYAAFPQQHRDGGSFGQAVFAVDQDPIDLIDSAVPDFIVTMARSPLHEIAIDVGDGVCRSEKMPPGTLGLYPPDTESHTFLPHTHSILTFTLPMSRVTAWLDEAGIRHDPYGPLYGQLRFAPHAVRLLDAIWRAAEAPHGVDDLLIDGLTLQLLALLAIQGGDRAPERGLSATNDQRIIRVIDYIESHFDSALSVGELAAVAAMSPGHFSRVFKAATGEPIWAYVQRRRCERAQEMLEFAGEPIAAVAHACGFSSQAHFTHCFRQAFGVTPAAFRKATQS